MDNRSYVKKKQKTTLFLSGSVYRKRYMCVLNVRYIYRVYNTTRVHVNTHLRHYVICVHYDYELHIALSVCGLLLSRWTKEGRNCFNDRE